MSFFAPGEISASSPDKTIWQPLRGVRVRGCARDVELECRYYFNDEHRAALANEAFRTLEGDPKFAAEHDALARHVVVGWRNVPATIGGTEDALFSVEGCTELLGALRNSVMQRADGTPFYPYGAFLTELVNAKSFGAQLVDAGDVGNA